MRQGIRQNIFGQQFLAREQPVLHGASATPDGTFRENIFTPRKIRELRSLQTSHDGASVTFDGTSRQFTHRPETPRGYRLVFTEHPRPLMQCPRTSYRLSHLKHLSPKTHGGSISHHGPSVRIYFCNSRLASFYPTFMDHPRSRMERPYSQTLRNFHQLVVGL